MCDVCDVWRFGYTCFIALLSRPLGGKKACTPDCFVMLVGVVSYLGQACMGERCIAANQSIVSRTLDRSAGLSI